MNEMDRFLSDDILKAVVTDIITSREYTVLNIKKLLFDIDENTALPCGENKVSDYGKDINRLLKELGYKDKYNDNLSYETLSNIQERMMRIISSCFLYIELEDEVNLKRNEESHSEKNEIEVEYNDSANNYKKEKQYFTLLEVVFIAALVSSLTQSNKTYFYSTKPLTTRIRYNIIQNIHTYLENELIDHINSHSEEKHFEESVARKNIKAQVFKRILDQYKDLDLFLALTLSEFNKLKQTDDYIYIKENVLLKETNELKNIVKSVIFPNEKMVINKNSIWYHKNYEEMVSRENIFKLYKLGRENKITSRFSDEGKLVQRITNTIITKCLKSDQYNEHLDCTIIDDIKMTEKLKNSIAMQIDNIMTSGLVKSRISRKVKDEVSKKKELFYENYEAIRASLWENWKMIDTIAESICQPMLREVTDLFHIYKNDKVLMGEDSEIFLEKHQDIGEYDSILKFCVAQCASLFEIEDGLTKELCKKIIVDFNCELRYLRDTLNPELLKDYQKSYNDQKASIRVKDYNEIDEIEQRLEKQYIERREEKIKGKVTDTIIIDKTK